MKDTHPTLRLVLSIGLIASLVGGYFVVRWAHRSSGRMRLVWEWIRNPDSHPHWGLAAGQRCAQAPFAMPTSGFIGFLWGDSFRPGHTHQGIDIFGGTKPGLTPVYAAYAGYLTRLPDWKSSLIVRIPQDPLQPHRQIWTYYTHMADRNGASYISPAFPPGTTEHYIQAGTFLGYQGNYSGDPGNPTGVHLHFSIVKDDGQGRFLNELKVQNTLDPSPYLGLPLNAKTNPGVIPSCEGSTREPSK